MTSFWFGDSSVPLASVEDVSYHHLLSWNRWGCRLLSMAVKSALNRMAVRKTIHSCSATLPLSWIVAKRIVLRTLQLNFWTLNFTSHYWRNHLFVNACFTEHGMNFKQMFCLKKYCKLLKLWNFNLKNIGFDCLIRIESSPIKFDFPQDSQIDINRQILNYKNMRIKTELFEIERPFINYELWNRPIENNAIRRYRYSKQIFITAAENFVEFWG